MEPGAFSVSLAVKDINTSRSFYETLGFSAMGEYGGADWVILRNGAAVIGLFQGMFERNILTFNPGWDADAQPLDTYTDVRDIQRLLKASGIKLEQEADETTTGPASFIVVDPDGNQILFDQHI